MNKITVDQLLKFRKMSSENPIKPLQHIPKWWRVWDRKVWWKIWDLSPMPYYCVIIHPDAWEDLRNEKNNNNL